MLPNYGRESAHVISRVKDKSKLPSNVENIPLFVCISPKQGSIEPVLIRDEDGLLQEFGDPSISPDMYKDLLTIRDFVRAGRSCWVSRIDYDPMHFDSVYYIKDTILLVFQLWFKYPLWDTLTPEQKAITNCGYYKVGSSYIWRCSNHLGVVKDYPIETYILDLIKVKDKIKAETGWEMIVPEDTNIYIAEKHNIRQEYNVATSGGKKYLTMRWKCKYTTPENHKLTISSLNLPLDNDGVFNRKPSGSLPSAQTTTVIPVNVLSEEGLTGDYEKVEMDEGEYIRTGVRYIFDNFLYPAFYKAVKVSGKQLWRLYTGSGSATRTDFYFNQNWVLCDQNGNAITSLGSSRVYIDDKSVMEKVNRTLHLPDSSIEDISAFLTSTTWDYVVPRLESLYGIEISFPVEYSPENTLLTQMDISLVSYDKDTNIVLFRTESPLSGYPNLINFTSYTNLKPASAGIKINYALIGYDLSEKMYLIEDSITIPNNFNDQQFADAMSKNPYIKMYVDYPDSHNIYNSFSKNYIQNMESLTTSDISVELDVSSYIKSLVQYNDKKYYGCFIGDLSFPCIKWVTKYDPEYGYYDVLDIVPMNEDDRKAIHWNIKQIAAQRQDLICIFTTPNLPIDNACEWVSSLKDYADYFEYGKKNALDYLEQSFYCEMYYGWMSYRTSLISGTPYKIKEVAPTVFIIGNIVDSWLNRGISYPVAGDQGGTLNSNTDLVNVLNNPDSKNKKDKLISYRINPIWDTGTRGIQIYGNETLNPAYTDLSAAHIARMFVKIKSDVDAYSETIKFSLNNQYTWGTWINYVSSKILDPLKSQGGLVWYDVQMGEDTTSRLDIANRKINGKVSLQFRQDLEIIDLEYTILPSSEDDPISGVVKYLQNR